MSDFTNDEKRRIDYLYASDFKDVTADDIVLIQKFERQKAIEDAKVQAELQAIADEASVNIEETRKTAALAREQLEEHAKRSRERWERLRYGQEETR